MTNEITDFILGPANSDEELQRLLLILENDDATSEQISLALASLTERLNDGMPIAPQERTRLNRALSHLVNHAETNFLKHKE